MPRIGRASRWFGILSVALSVGVLILVASRVSDARALIDRIPASGHIIALAAVVASLAARALRLIHLSRPSGKRSRWSTALAAHLMGDAAASVTPARSGGDPMRVWVTRRDGFTAAAAAGLVAGEVVGDLLIVVALAVSLAIFAEPVRMVALATAGFSGLMATILLVLAIRGPGKGKEPPPKPLALLGMPRKAWRGVRLASLRFRRTLRGVRRAPAGAQVTTLALSVINVGCRLAILPILALSLGGVFSFQRLVAWPLLLLYPGAALPPPGGGGIIEAGFATSLVTDFGPEEMAVALLWWWRSDAPDPAPTRAKLHHSIPIVSVSNLDAGIRYYTDQLGFEHEWSHGEPPDFASVSRGHVVVFLCEDCQGVRPTWIMVFTDDVDALHAELERRGATIREAPVDREWGLREMLVEDADGNVIRFGQGTDDGHGLVPAPVGSGR